MIYKKKGRLESGFFLCAVCRVVYGHGYILFRMIRQKNYYEMEKNIYYFCLLFFSYRVTLGTMTRFFGRIDFYTPS